MGSTAPAVGLAVHLAVAAAIGVLFALWFRHHTPDLGAAVGWGLAYGLAWWVIGGLTLLPVLLGAAPAWTVDAAAERTPALVGHLAYGIAMAVAISAIDARFSPWWIARHERQRRRL
jgi:uncharacterized membrane protein YagU involved in acid resistance